MYRVVPKPSFDLDAAPALAISGNVLDMLLCQVLARGMSFRFRARGYSMSPFIRDGDVVTIAPKTGRPLRPGAIVAAHHPASGKLIVHRIIAAQANGFILQGDNAVTPDGWVSSAQVLGSVTRVERGAKRIRLGLGPERYWIAFLARQRWLPLILFQGRRRLPRFLWR